MFVWRVSLTYPLPLRSLPLLSVEVDEELPIRLRSAPRVSRWTKAETSRLGARPRPPARCFLVSPWFPEKKGFHWGFDTGYKDKCIYIYIHIVCIYIYDNFIGDIIWFMWEYAGYITTRCDSGVSEFTPKGPGCDLDLGMHPQRP